MRYFHKTRQQFHEPIINVDRLWTLASKETREKYESVNGENDKVPVIDVTRAVITNKHIHTHTDTQTCASTNVFHVDKYTSANSSLNFSI